MKKNKLILSISIILGCIILGCFYYITQSYKQTHITKDKTILDTKTKQEDYFQKKIECEKYKEDILKDINKYNNSQKPEIRNSNNDISGEPINNLYVEQKELKELFYSPKINSCVYLESMKTLVKRGENANPDVGNWAISYDTYYLIDVLTGKQIDFNKGLPFLQIIHGGEIFNSEQDADQIIEEYR